MIATLTAWTREAAHTRRRDARPGYQPPRVLWLGPILAAGEGHLSAAAVEHLMARQQQPRGASEGERECE